MLSCYLRTRREMLQQYFACFFQPGVPLQLRVVLEVEGQTPEARGEWPSRMVKLMLVFGAKKSDRLTPANGGNEAGVPAGR